MNSRCLVKGYVLFMVSMSVSCINHWHFAEIKKNFPAKSKLPPIIWNGKTIHKSDLFQQVITEENHREKSDQLFKMLTGNYVVRLMNMMNIIERMAEVIQELSEEELWAGSKALKEAIAKFEESIFLVEIDILKYSNAVPKVVARLIGEIESVKKNVDFQSLNRTFSEYIDLCREFFRGEYYMDEYDGLRQSEVLICYAEYRETGEKKSPMISLYGLLVGVRDIRGQIVRDIKNRAYKQ